MMEKKLPIPGRYRHYKGKEYEVLSIARHSETEEEMVLYRTLYGDFGQWVRPASMFVENVEVNGVIQPRFAYLGPMSSAQPVHVTDLPLTGTQVSQPLVLNSEELPIDGWSDPVRGTISWRTIFSADQTATDSLTLGIAEVAPNARFNRHRHPVVEVYYILAGTGEVEIADQRYKVSAGNALFIPKNAIHAIYNPGHEPLRLIYAFAVNSFAEVPYSFPEE